METHYTEHELNYVWLGNFRRNWPVDRWGKWAEYEYSSPIYPSYTCGAGNLMSFELSNFIAKNIQSLKHYQGEDVSFGIWFAAIHTQYVHVSKNLLLNYFTKEEYRIGE